MAEAVIRNQAGRLKAVREPFPGIRIGFLRRRSLKEQINVPKAKGTKMPGLEDSAFVSVC